MGKYIQHNEWLLFCGYEIIIYPFSDCRAHLLLLICVAGISIGIHRFPLADSLRLQMLTMEHKQRQFIVLTDN